MEDRNKIAYLSQTWQSEGKFKHDWCQTFKNSMTIENRVRILEMERHKKLKDIERKLDIHKKNVSIKIIKSQRKRDVKGKDDEENQNVTMFNSRAKFQRKKRETNIKGVRDEIAKAKKKQFNLVKQQSQEIEKRIKEERQLELEEKIKKRNKVRLMEIQSKQNLMSSWSKRLEDVKEDRVKLISNKMKQHQQNLVSIAKQQKKERKILDEIFHAENIETDLTMMIHDEERMNGDELERLYSTKK